MKRILSALLALVCLPFFPAFGAAQGIVGAGAGDVYAPLKLYDGKWEIRTAGADAVTRVENHCARTGLFYACEQSVDGKTAGLLIFLPTAKANGGGQEYRTQALSPDASPAGDWNKLTITGECWVYTWENSEGGKKTLWRNTNTFSGEDRIHFEIARSDDGTSWKTVKSGDEQRVK
jgi:hypothetical protein